MINPLVDYVLGHRRQNQPDIVADLRFRSGHTGRYKITHLSDDGLATIEDVRGKEENINFNDVESLTQVGRFYRYPEQAFPLGTDKRREHVQITEAEAEPEGEGPEGSELGEIPGPEGEEPEKEQRDQGE
jgi:hypothetical protein